MSSESIPVTLRTSDYHFSANPEYVERLRGAGLSSAAGFDVALRAGREVPGGRGPHRLLELPGAKALLRLREARRGGVLGGLFRGRFLSPRRTARELELWLVLCGRGAPLPTPVAALSRRRRGLWESHFCTVNLAGSVDGLAWLDASPPPEERRRVASALAKALRQFHDAGAVHGDLNLRNVLIEQDSAGPHCLFIDLDHARIRRQVSPPERMADLMRLARSIEKRGFKPLLDRRLQARVLMAYCAGDRGLRGALLASSRSELRSLVRHRIAWRFEQAFSRLLPPRFSRGSLAGLALVATISLLATACRDPEPASARTPSTPAWSILAVGDTGRAGERWDPFEGQIAVADAMRREAQRERVDGLVFLGDNFYDSGLLQADLEARVRVNLVRPYCYFLALNGLRSPEVASACPLAESERRPVPLFAVLGNHDLEGAESARLQREAIPEFLPEWQMSAGLTRVVEVHPGVSLILFESEISIDDRTAIRRELMAAIRAARGPWRILVTHRPIATDDFGRPPKGGYPDWVRDVIAEAALPVQLVLCGHHHSLQAFALRDPTPLLQIGAGSGSRAEPPLATGHPDLRYSKRALGFVRVALRDKAESEWLEVTLYAVPPWPWLGRLLDHRPEARFGVDRAGRIALLPARDETSRPDA